MKLPIESIIDTDLYKITMAAAVIKKFPWAKVKYKFYERDNISFPKGFAEELKKVVNDMKYLSLKESEKDFLIKKTGHYLDPAFLSFLEGYRFDPNEVYIEQDDDGHLKIEICGYWFRTIFWEVPLMSVISELFFYMTNQKTKDIKNIIYESANKAKKLNENNVNFVEFGTRRRFSFLNQFTVTKQLKLNGGENFRGTSNVYLASLLDINVVGTMAHEWIMYHAAIYGFSNANFMALKNWKDVFKGYLGTSLADTYTSKVFFDSYKKEYAELFTGVRQDSGDPIQFAELAINHYKSLGIDPLTKTIVFSDSLNVDKAIEIDKFCHNKIKTSFGIGTNFSNDVGVKPLNMVIKLDSAEFNEKYISTVKISDSHGKYTGNEEMIKLCLLNLMLFDVAKKNSLINDRGEICINTNKL